MRHPYPSPNLKVRRRGNQRLYETSVSIFNPVNHSHTLILSYLVLRMINFHPEITDNEILTLRSILTHKIFQQLLDMRLRHNHDWLYAHIRSNEARKFLRRDFSQPFETRDFGFTAQLFHGFLLSLFVVTIKGFLFVPYPE